VTLVSLVSIRRNWTILSLGYFDQQGKGCILISKHEPDNAGCFDNQISYPQVFPGIDVRYTCQNVRVKEEFVLSQQARKDLPDPAQYGISRDHAYLMITMELDVQPANLKALANRRESKTDIKPGNRFAFEGDDPIDFEDQDSTQHFFFAKDYAWAVAQDEVHQMLVEWDEGIATKDLRLFEETGIPWSTPYAGINGTDANAQYESTLLFQETTATGWKTWDLSALTQKWVNGSATNYGVILWATNENTDGKDLRFRSSEYTVFQNYWPKLEITYSTEVKTVYFLKDHLGSIRATVLDSIGAPVIGYDDYDPWGYPLALRTKAIPNAYLQGASKNKFTGNEWDDEYGLNLYHFDWRPYDPETARWLILDALADVRPQESPYSYAGNNPIVRIDPDGLYWVDTNGDGVADTWVVEEPIVTTAERPSTASSVSSTRRGLAGLGTIALVEPTPVGEAIFVVGSAIYAGYRIGQYLSEEAASEEKTRNPAQDKRLSKGEIKKLQDNDIDPEQLKKDTVGGNPKTGGFDLFKDKNGDIYVKPSDGRGPGEPTGININKL